MTRTYSIRTIARVCTLGILFPAIVIAAASFLGSEAGYIFIPVLAMCHPRPTPARRIDLALVAFVLFGVGAAYASPRVRFALYRAGLEREAAPLPELGADVWRRDGSWGVIPLDRAHFDDEQLRTWIPHLKTLGVEEILLPDTKVGDEGLRELCTVPSLHAIDVSGTTITDEGLSEIAKMPELEYLDVERTAVSDVGIEYLVGASKLHSLLLGETRITDASLERFEEMPTLRSINVGGTAVSHERAAEFRRQIPQANLVGR